MRKIILAVLSVVLTFSLASCGNDNDNMTSNVTTTAPNVTTTRNENTSSEESSADDSLMGEITSAIDEITSAMEEAKDELTGETTVAE